MSLAAARTARVLLDLGVQEMKTLFSVLAIVALACPAYAVDNLLFQESFDVTPDLVGTQVAGWNGWTQDIGSGAPVFSGTVLDEGTSVSWSGVPSSGIAIGKTFAAYTPAAGEHFVLTATLLAPDAGTGGYSDLRLMNTAAGKFVQAAVGYNAGVLFGENGNTGDVRNGAITIPVDVAMVITDTSLHGYSRAHGDAVWTDAGTVDLTGKGMPLSGWNKIWQVGIAAGGADSIQLIATTAPFVVPEPSTFALLAAGLTGLLCYAWKKRK
jgi:hypothetical protein